MVKATDTGALVPVSDTGTDTGTAVRVPDGRLISDLGTVQKRIWDTQCRFLAAYSLKPWVGRAAAMADISADTVSSWTRQDYLGFRERLHSAKESYLDTLEEQLDALGEKQALPLMFRLNGERAHKYRPQAPVDDTAVRVLDEFRTLFQTTRGGVSGGHDDAVSGIKEPPAPAGEAP